MQLLWRDWLPPHVAGAAMTKEPLRFTALSRAIEDEWRQRMPRDMAANACDMLKWVPILNMFIKSKVKFKIEDVHRVVEVALEIVTEATNDVVAQVRWASCLSKMLRSYRHDLKIEVHWRKLYMLLHEIHFKPSISYQGAAVMESRKEALLQLVCKSRRFFPEGSAAQIWAEFHPRLLSIHQQDAYEALGWLCLFMPTHAAVRLDGDWDSWVKTWFQIWGSVVHNNYWDSLWMSLIARLIKHDKHGAVNWKPHLDSLFTHTLWGFQVPVGTSSSSIPISRQAPQECEMIFGRECTPISASSAKAIAFLLGRCSTGLKAPASLATEHAACSLFHNKTPVDSDLDYDDCVTVHMECLVDLLEQYYHPSNGGRWTNSLSRFLRHLMDNFMKRLAMDSLDLAANGSVDVSEGSCMEDNGKPMHALSRYQQCRFLHALVRLAGRAQFSKDTTMMESACGVLSQAAYVAPDMVLPVVQSRFNKAFEAVTATHLLVTGIHTLGMCIRPLLLAGVQSAALQAEMESHNDETTSKEDRLQAAWTVVANAMMATLPGIDANDPPKTLACFRLYSIILSSIGNLTGLSQEAGQDLPSCMLPMYTEEWVEEFLSRIFAMLSNLDCPEGGGATQDAAGGGSGRGKAGSFLLLGTSMFRPLLELLFARMPPDLRRSAIRHLSRFILTTTLPTVTTETSILCNAAAWADPSTTASEILAPLIDAALGELPECRGADYHLSQTSEGTLTWQLGLVAATLYHMGHQVLSQADRLKVVIDRALAICSSAPVQEAATRVLSALISSCVSYFPIDQYDAPASLLTDPHIEEWISKSTPTHIEYPVWHIPNMQQIEFAKELVELYLQAPCTKISDFCAPISGIDSKNKTRTIEDRDKLRIWMLCIEGILNGARTCLPDFQSKCPVSLSSHDSMNLALVGEAGTPLDLKGIREHVAGALFAAYHWVPEHDTDSLKVVIRLIGMTISTGAQEYEDAMQSMAAWQTDEQSLHQTAIAGFICANGGSKTGDAYSSSLVRQRPRWLAIERVHLHGLWRASQAAYRPWVSCTHLEAGISTIPESYCQLFNVLLTSSVHLYTAVRDASSSILERCLKRYPCLVHLTMPAMLQCLAWHAAGPSVLPLSEYSDPKSLLLTITKEMKMSLRQPSTMICPDISGEDEDRKVQQRMEAAAMGACHVLRGRACWRFVGRDAAALTALLRAICLSSSHTSVKSQNAINDLFLIMTLRFIRPPIMGSAKPGETGMVEILPAVTELVEDLLLLASADTVELHWRYSIIANAFLLFLLPVTEPNLSARLSKHFMQLLVCDLLPLRQLALSAISFQVDALPMFGHSSDWSKRLQDVTSQTLLLPGYPSAVLENMAHGHTQLAPDIDGAGRARPFGSAMNREEAVIKSISATLTRFREWPVGKKRPAAIKSGQFLLQHARGIRSMSSVQPEEWCLAFEGAVREALQDLSSLGEKNYVCAAAEILSGFLASGAAFAIGKHGRTAWDSWMKDLIISALATSPLELADMWGLTLRYAVNGLCDSGNNHALGQVLDVVATPPPQGVSSGILIKYLKCVSHCLNELCSTGGRSMSSSMKFHLEIISQIPSLSAIPLASVRREVARCMTALVARTQLPAAENIGNTDALDEAVSIMCCSVTLNIKAGVSYVLANSTSAFVGGISLQNEEVSSQDAVDVGETDHMKIHASNNRVDVIHDAIESCQREAAISRLGTSLQFIVRCLRSGDALNASCTLVECLPSLLQIQEMPDPELQPLAMEAKTAFALLKYLPVQHDLVPQVADILCQAPSFNPWHARASALVFMQYFWFRQVYLLSPDHSQKLLSSVVAMMGDKKVEVQEIACASFSGIVRAQPANAAALLRVNFLEETKKMVSKRQTRRHASAKYGSAMEKEQGISVASQHACVLGLKAFVLSSPYDVPRWLPEVLMSLVGVSSTTPPMKTTAIKALGEFRRTHEAQGLQECRDFFDSDQWEAIQGVSSTVSYFV